MTVPLHVGRVIRQAVVQDCTNMTASVYKITSRHYFTTVFPGSADWPCEIFLCVVCERRLSMMMTLYLVCAKVLAPSSPLVVPPKVSSSVVLMMVGATTRGDRPYRAQEGGDHLLAVTIVR